MWEQPTQKGTTKMSKNAKGSRGTRARRGKSESMTGAKEAQVETRIVGDQSELALPSRADVRDAVNEIKGWNAKIETLSSKRKLSYKAWKARHVSSETIKELIALERGDAKEFRQHLEAYAIGLAATGAPFQINVFDTAYGSDVEQAKAEATIAAKAGRAPECRYAEGSEAHDAYMERYASIQSAMVPGADLLSEAERASAVAAGRADAHQDQVAGLH